MNGRIRGLLLVVACALLLWGIGVCISRTADQRPRGQVEAQEGP